MTKTLTAAVLTALALTLSACGGNDDAEASKAISDSIMKEQKSGDASSQLFSMKKSEADCIGDGLVKEVGTDQLKEYGLLTEDNKAKNDVTNVKMKADDAESSTDVLFDCTKVEEMVKGAIAESGSVPKEMQTCIDKVLTEETLRPMFSQVFQGKSEEAQKQLTEPLTECAMGNAG